VTIPSAHNHLLQARENRAHAEWLLASRATDNTALQWAVTAAFYAALHGLTAYLMVQGVRVSNHAARARALRDPNSGIPHRIYSAYRDLEVWSRGARYELWNVTTQDAQDLLDQELASIATFVGM
jgi:hypothetical protein